MKKSINFFLTIFVINMALAQDEVPYSNHKEDQFVQGPCYVFAAVAAMESKALQAIGKEQGGFNEVNFNEWLYWSTCVQKIDPEAYNLSPFNTIDNTINHMIRYGASTYPDQLKLTKEELPNTSGCGAGRGLVKFNGCNNWCNDNGGYVPIDIATSLSYQVCSDENNKKYELTEFYSNREYDFSEVSLKNITTKNANSVIQQLKNGNGVIAVINDFRSSNCEGSDYLAQHAIFIYKYNESTDRFTYKDSWGVRQNALLGKIL